MKSLLGIMEAQFRGKGAPGGAAGVVTRTAGKQVPMKFYDVSLPQRPKAMLRQSQPVLQVSLGRKCHLLRSLSKLPELIYCQRSVARMALMQECPPLLRVLESAGFRLPELLHRAGYSQTVRVRNIHSFRLLALSEAWLPSCGYM